MNLPQLFLHLLLICCLTSSKIECHFLLKQAIDRISSELEADAEYFQEMAKDKSGLYAELQKCVDFDLHNETFIEYCLKVALKVMTVDGCQTATRQSDACIFSTHYLQRFTMSKWAQDER